MNMQRIKQSFDKLSPENVEKINEVLKILLDELELGGVNRLTMTTKVPLSGFRKAGFEYEDVVRVVYKADVALEVIRPEEVKRQWSNDPVLANVSGLPAPESTEDTVLLAVKDLSFKKLRAKVNEVLGKQGKAIADIFYNPKPGIGWAKGWQFKFKDHTGEYRIFEELYAHLNDTVERKRVLELSDYKQGVSPSDYVNDLVKEIRKKTKLTTTQLVNNNGNLTLVGNKLNEPPLP